MTILVCFHHTVSHGQSTTLQSPSLSRSNMWPLSSSWNPSTHLALFFKLWRYPPSDAMLTPAISPITGRLIEGRSLFFLPVQVQRTCPLHRGFRLSEVPGLSYNRWGFQARDTLQDSIGNSSINKVETSLEWQVYFSQFQDTTDVLPCHNHLPVCLWIMDPHSRAPKKNTSHGN